MIEMLIIIVFCNVGALVTNWLFRRQQLKFNEQVLQFNNATLKRIKNVESSVDNIANHLYEKFGEAP